MESAIKKLPLIRSTQGAEEHIGNIEKVQSNGNLNCCHCEREDLSQNCLFKDKECFFCHKKGTYIAKLCKVKKKNGFIQGKTNLVQEAESDED